MKTVFLIFQFMLLATYLNAQTIILHGDKSTEVEMNAAQDLKEDILHVFPSEAVDIQDANTPIKDGYNRIFVLGTKESNKLIKKVYSEKQSQLLETELEPETFVLQTLPFQKGKSIKTLYIIGADDRGTYYGIYEFSSKILGIDALEYWTGKKPEATEKFEIPEMSFREKPPTFSRRGYFDNDDDMLANWKGRKLIVEFEIWEEMINSLARLRYNYIDPFDLLGRPEYYKGDYYYYNELTEYHSDLDLINQVIDHIHSKGLMVQIPMYLGWEFHHIDFDKLCLSKYHDHWMEVYEYYLTKTPFAKGDIFLSRPRHPIYDYGYYCEEEEKAGIKTGPLMTKMFKGLQELINKYRPGATLVCDLWREGRPMWKNGEFEPDKNIEMLWADYYGGDFREWPEDQKGYEFGIYIHAGIWLNHVMQDPLVHQISTAVKEAVSRDMTNNIFVNGQDFKHFILNLEVCARLGWDAEGFDPDEFYREWTSRYFGEKASPLVINSLKLLNEAHNALAGYKDITTASVITLNNLEKGELKLSGDKIKILRGLGLAKASLQTAITAASLVPEESQLVFDDQIVFPATIYLDDILLLEAVTLYGEFLQSGIDDKATYDYYANNMKNALVTMRNRLDKGSKWKKWDGWTKCENFRIYTPPPKIEQMDKIIKKYQQ